MNSHYAFPSSDLAFSPAFTAPAASHPASAQHSALSAAKPKPKYPSYPKIPTPLTTPSGKATFFGAISKALLDYPSDVCHLVHIYEYIKKHFPEMTRSPSWKNSIRQKLSSDERFYRVSGNTEKGLWGFREYKHKRIPKMSIDFILNEPHPKTIPSQEPQFITPAFQSSHTLPHAQSGKVRAMTQYEYDYALHLSQNQALPTEQGVPISRTQSLLGIHMVSAPSQS